MIRDRIGLRPLHPERPPVGVAGVKQDVVDASLQEVAVAGFPETGQRRMVVRQVQVAGDQDGTPRPGDDALQETFGLGAGEVGVAVGEVDTDEVEGQPGVVDARGQRDAALEGVAVGAKRPHLGVDNGEAAEDRRTLLEAQPSDRAVGAGVDGVEAEFPSQAVGETAFAERAPGLLQHDDVGLQP